jgi:arsenate reductase (thioredoxin)
MSTSAGRSGNRPFHVLLLCTHNSALVAECIINRLGSGIFNAYSAGSQPSGKVHPYALELLQTLKYDTSGLRSKSWEQFSRPDASGLNFVFTVCDDAAEETCPVWPGQPMSALWGSPDPSRAVGSKAERRLAFGVAKSILRCTRTM